MPEIREEDLIEGGAGVRAQACDRTGGLLDDFLILEDKQVINVCNAPSPAATSSLSIGKTVADWARKKTLEDPAIVTPRLIPGVLRNALLFRSLTPSVLTKYPLVQK